MNTNTVAHDTRTRCSELTIEHLTACNLELTEENRMLKTENAGFRGDNDWLREFLAAAIHKLHAAHLKRLDRQKRYHRLLDELRAIRSAQRAEVSATTNLPKRVTQLKEQVHTSMQVTGSGNLPERTTGRDGKRYQVIPTRGDDGARPSLPC